MKQLMMMLAVVGCLAGAATASTYVYDDFEGTDGNGSLGNWWCFGPNLSVSVSTDAASSGTHSLKLAVSQDMAQYSWPEVLSGMYSAGPAIDWNAADGYVVQFDVKSGQASTGTQEGGFRYFAGGGWAGGAGFNLVGDTAWHTITIDTTAASHDNTGCIDLFFNSLKAGTYYIDNIRVVPEPVTLAMLAMGGLGLLRRRMA